MPDEKDVKKLKKLATLADDPNLALHDELSESNEHLEAIHQITQRSSDTLEKIASKEMPEFPEIPAPPDEVSVKNFPETQKVEVTNFPEQKAPVINVPKQDPVVVPAPEVNVEVPTEGISQAIAKSLESFIDKIQFWKPDETRDIVVVDREGKEVDWKELLKRDDSYKGGAIGPSKRYVLDTSGRAINPRQEDGHGSQASDTTFVSPVVAGAAVSNSNPLPISDGGGTITVDGSVTVSGTAELIISNVIDTLAHDLNAGAFSETTSIANDYLLSRLELDFSTAESRDITVTTADGTKLYTVTGDTSLDFVIDFEDIGFNGGENITVDITQTAGACSVDVVLVAKEGSIALAGNPVLGASTALIGIPYDFLIEVSKGNVSGHAVETIIGRNTDVDTAYEDVWFQGGTISYLSSAETMDIASTSASDTSGGTGARTLELKGLDGNYDEVTETITMNGVSTVTSANSYLRVTHLKVLTVGSGNTTAGNITATATTAATVQALLPAGDNLTGKTHYTVPAGKTAYLMDIFPSLAAGKTGCDIAMVQRDSTVANSAFTMVQRFSVQSDGSSNINHPLRAPQSFSEKTDIKCTAKGAANDQDVSVQYQLLIVDN